MKERFFTRTQAFAFILMVVVAAIMLFYALKIEPEPVHPKSIWIEGMSPGTVYYAALCDASGDSISISSVNWIESGRVQQFGGVEVIIDPNIDQKKYILVVKYVSSDREGIVVGMDIPERDRCFYDVNSFIDSTKMLKKKRMRNNLYI